MVKNLHQKSLQTATAAKNSGFSLLEVLISIIILSFGMLGMVGLQAAALQSNREAKVQAVAVNLARELAEMMRSNKNVANTLLLATNPYLTGNLVSPLVSPSPGYCHNIGSTRCATTLAVAQAEITDWLTRVDSELPGARVNICQDGSAYDSNGIPQWSCTVATGAPIVLKLGWSRGKTNKTNTNLDRATDATSAPTVVLVLTPGN